MHSFTLVLLLFDVGSKLSRRAKRSDERNSKGRNAKKRFGSRSESDSAKESVRSTVRRKNEIERRENHLVLHLSKYLIDIFCFHLV